MPIATDMTRWLGTIEKCVRRPARMSRRTGERRSIDVRLTFDRCELFERYFKSEADSSMRAHPSGSNA
jgi:hypothetical protein